MNDSGLIAINDFDKACMNLRIRLLAGDLKMLRENYGEKMEGAKIVSNPKDKVVINYQKLSKNLGLH